MAIDLNHRPRLSDMRRFAPQEAAPAVDLEARQQGPHITDAESLSGRPGYAADFLGEFSVPWPTMSDERAGDVLPVSGSAENRLDYMHFSITMSASRRLAFYVGVNIDGAQSVSVERGKDRWSYDGRIPLEAQIGEDLYANNLLDRGHLVRREDPNWGNEAEVANRDTFHFTNCSPQMAGFNQKNWLDLENYLLENTRRWKERATVFTGPVFRDDDRRYRGVLIPSAFWKVVAFLSDDGKPSATAYMIDQSSELGQLDAAFGRFRTYQRSVRRIEQLTGINFGPLSRYDGFSNEEAMTGTRIEAELHTLADIRV
ncbi:DNA/RNA non-specific endonuclease [Pseudomonas luteola]|uniref:DNA/RNA non-specific endonuclease n=1 Tax=Pseudomonas luteola TaxID=47886 RepID=UPI001EF41102|nr:DNA/RNA non-specific endonuclease [Pseudomonas luteola]MCG7372400.1 DNA/RNA non-specific endonuclease [Pseudomonas luteola]